VHAASLDGVHAVASRLATCGEGDTVALHATPETFAAGSHEEEVVASTSDTGDRNRPSFQVEILSPGVIEEMVGKIREAARAPGARDAVARWRAAHGKELWHKRGHDFAVVGQTLMYLHDGPDGMLVPHSRYPEGTEKVYTDSAHAGEVYAPDPPDVEEPPGH